MTNCMLRSIGPYSLAVSHNLLGGSSIRWTTFRWNGKFLGVNWKLTVLAYTHYKDLYITNILIVCSVVVKTYRSSLKVNHSKTRCACNHSSKLVKEFTIIGLDMRVLDIVGSWGLSFAIGTMTMMISNHRFGNALTNILRHNQSSNSLDKRELT